MAVWTRPNDPTTWLVDWYVANANTINALEAALLADALPPGSDVTGLIANNLTASAYLAYYDAKHDTEFVPRRDPRYERTEAFPPLNASQEARFLVLRALANQRPQ